MRAATNVVAMCERCADLKERIQHCQRLIWQIVDRVTVERLTKLVSDYEAQLERIDCANKN